jgi:hypothetical protein
VFHIKCVLSAGFFGNEIARTSGLDTFLKLRIRLAMSVLCCTIKDFRFYTLDDKRCTVSLNQISQQDFRINYWLLDLV